MPKSIDEEKEQKEDDRDLASSWRFTRDDIDALPTRWENGAPRFPVFIPPDRDGTEGPVTGCILYKDTTRNITINGHAFSEEKADATKEIDDRWQSWIESLIPKDKQRQALRAAYSQSPAGLMFSLAVQVNSSCIGNEHSSSVREGVDGRINDIVVTDDSVRLVVKSTIDFYGDGMRLIHREPYVAQFIMCQREEQGEMKWGFDLEYIETTSPHLAAVCKGKWVPLLNELFTKVKNAGVPLTQDVCDQIHELAYSVEEINKKAVDLKRRGYGPAAIETQQLYEKLTTEIKKLGTSETAKTIEKNCKELINTAQQGVLKDHRGFFGRVFHGILVALHFITCGAVTIKQTASLQKIDKVSESLNGFFTSHDAMTKRDKKDVVSPVPEDKAGAPGPSKAAPPSPERGSGGPAATP